jgi:HEAT repeat protein
VRAAAAAALGRIREPAAIDPLVAMLREPMEGDRVAASEALLSFGSAAVPGLLAALDGAGPHAQSEILNVLAGIADPRAVAAVVAAAMPPAPPMMAPGGADPAIDARSRRERAATRLWALETLGRIPVAESLPALEKGARDRDPAVRETALASLSRQATPAAFAVLRGVGDTAGYADDIRDAARAALASGYATLAAAGRLGEWIAELRGAAEFLETMTLVTEAGPAWDGVIAAVGGRDAAIALLDDLARRLPAPGSGRARALAARLRQPPPG